MKSKRQSITHKTRHAAFLAEIGGEYPRAMSPEFSALCSELIGIDTPEMVQNRVAHEGTTQGYIEGKRNLDGSYTRDDGGDECGAASAFVFHTPGAGVDCELDEVGAMVAATATHSSGGDKGETETVNASELL